MAGVALVPPGGGEVVGDSPDRRVELLSDDDSLHATWSRFGPGRAGADLHIHRRHTDLFFVLEGELTLRLGRAGEEVTAPAGTLARLPPFVVHGFRNGSGDDVRYLNLHAPGRGFADYMRAMRDGRALTYDQEEPPADGVRPASEAVLASDGPAAERAGLRLTLLADVEEVAVALAGGEPGRPPDVHVHRRHVESFYVLEGELALHVDGRALHAPAGTWLQVPAGVAHAVACKAPARFLNVHTPSCGFGAFVRDGPGAAFDQHRAPARA